MIDPPACCPACESEAWIALPLPHPERSMASDFRVIDAPLLRYCCARCGLAAAKAPREIESLYVDDYRLYGHAAGLGDEGIRQSSYAAWIAEKVDTPSSLFEAGCGNGGLLLALRERWPHCVFAGIEPAPEAALHARAAGFDAQRGFLQARAAGERHFEAALAVNVMEHARDPVAFLSALASHADRVIAVCPSGDVPNSELLVADHLFSFNARSLALLFALAGLELEERCDAPRGIGYFQMAIGRPARTASQVPAFSENGALCEARSRYLHRVSTLDDALLRRLSNSPTVVSFGAGEAAALLRAYAPRSWSRVTTCTVDVPETRSFGDRTIVPYESLRPSSTVLVAVRPGVAKSIANRLRRDGHEPVLWNDLVPA